MIKLISKTHSKQTLFKKPKKFKIQKIAQKETKNKKTFKKNANFTPILSILFAVPLS